MNVATRIEKPEVETDTRGKIKRVSVVFGPHHFFDVFIEDGKVRCAMGATHHGIKADASEVNSELNSL